MSSKQSEYVSASPFREIIESGAEDDGYEPQPLWLIPIFLRSRIQYYDEIVERIYQRIEELWKKFGQQYDTREEFEQSGAVRGIWHSEHPYWWGLNDIVGWIDVRACIRSREIQAALFLPTKRISRLLKNKKYVFHRKETISLSEGIMNEQLQESLIQIVERICEDDLVKKLYVDLNQWRRLVRHTDLIGIIREATKEPGQGCSKDQ